MRKFHRSSLKTWRNTGVRHHSLPLSRTADDDRVGIHFGRLAQGGFRVLFDSQTKARASGRRGKLAPANDAGSIPARGSPAGRAGRMRRNRSMMLSVFGKLLRAARHECGPQVAAKFLAKEFDVSCHMSYSSSRSMRTCTYISTVIWPTMSVARATRHSRLSRGCVFSLGLSRSYKGQSPETNLDNPEVSR